MYNFNQQIIMVTGAGRGSGRAYALALAARGATVIAIDNGGDLMGTGHNPQCIQSVVDTAQELAGSILGYCVDVTNAQAVAEVIEITIARFERIDGLICNAGILALQQSVGAELSLYRKQMETNFFAQIQCIQQVLPYLQRQQRGRIVLTSGISTLYGDPQLMGYAASNAAIIGFLRSFSLQLTNSNITANLIIPAHHSRLSGLFDTPYDMENMTADRVTPAVLWLLSEQAPNGAMVPAGGNYYSLITANETEGVMLAPSECRPQIVAKALGRLMPMVTKQKFSHFSERTSQILRRLRSEHC
ncbi:MAG: SDR family oxidoreductase [Ferrimonas sp.]